MLAKTHMLRSLCVLLSVVVVGLLGLVSASPVLAASAWWHLNSGSRPANLQAGQAKDEVQEIDTTASFGTGGVGILEVEGQLVGIVFAGTSAAEVEAQLEGPYGAGNVHVSGGPVGTGPLVVTSIGGSADREVSKIEVLGEHISASVLTKGRGDGEIVLTASNLGDADANGANIPISLTDRLPAGLKAVAIEGLAGASAAPGDTRGPVQCSLEPELSCTFSGALPPYEQIQILISVVIEGGAGGVNEAKVSGGGAAGVSATSTVAIGGHTQFGVENYEMSLEEEGGAVDRQAGSHPFQLTSTLTLNQTLEPTRPPALARDLRFKLPQGLVGNPTPFPRCTDQQFLNTQNFIDGCPDKTALGVADVTIVLPGTENEPNHVAVPLFNLEPETGEPARFGFDALNVPVVLDTSVSTGEGYGVTVSVDNVSQTATFIASRVTFWGVPGDPRHNSSRGWNCIRDGVYREAVERFEKRAAPCTALGEDHPQPFLSLPTSCPTNPETHEPEPLQTSVEADSWAEPKPAGQGLVVGASEPLPALQGCNALPFTPSISVAPDGQEASTPTGLNVGVRVPQEEDLNAEGLDESDVKDLTVALPAGVAVNPAGGDGLQACSNAQIGFKGTNPQTGTDDFTPGAPSCPEASKVATVKIKTPLLPNELTGAVYLASPQNFAGLAQNPFESLVALYLVAEDPVSGVLVKLPGKVSLDPVTGQLTSTFEAPQLPFEEAKLEFFGSDRAPLTTPALCGTYTTTTSITPWSGNEAATPSSSFNVVTGPDGSGAAGCSSPRQFAPGFNAQTTNIQAGAFTPFTLTMSRPDQDQTLGRIEVTMPPGLSGTLSSVKLCPEPQASQGTCGPESLIGETVVSAGLGGDPYTVTGGKVYITTGYNGAPYGLSIVNPAAAGPFVLDEGRPVIVRASIYVDPHTATLKIVSDPLPTILDGIPLQIQHVNVTINRPGFTFNPTSCNKMAVNGTLFSSEGAPAAVSTPFQVTNCERLAFKPTLTATTAGKTSKADGASLTVKLAFPKTPQGTEANIKTVKVDLPKQLPSRLIPTLQSACLAKVFEADPENCPTDSDVGHAKAITPILPVPLEGPAYFVSHGDEAFPSLIIVLKGYGVTVDLVGTTFISKAGVTSSTFKTVPDVPVGSFELTLPERPYSALAANLPEKDHGNLCGQKLTMPTAFTGQNGAEIHEDTSIAVEGCSTAVAFTSSIKRQTLTLSVHTPAAGKVTATGKGLTTVSKTAKGQEDVTITLKQKKAGKFKTSVKVVFKPSQGKKQVQKSAKVTFKE